jgi:hypothetical protein
VRLAGKGHGIALLEGGTLFDLRFLESMFIETLSCTTLKTQPETRVARDFPGCNST